MWDWYECENSGMVLNGITLSGMWSFGTCPECKNSVMMKKWKILKCSRLRTFKNG